MITCSCEKKILRIAYSAKHAVLIFLLVFNLTSLCNFNKTDTVFEHPISLVEILSGFTLSFFAE